MLVLALLAFSSVPQSSADVRVREIRDAQVHELEVPHEGSTVETTCRFAGNLSIWATSSSDRFVLKVTTAGRGAVETDRDSGGGGTPWVMVNVRAGDMLRVELAVDPPEPADELDSSTPMPATLHLVAAPEDDDTRKATMHAATVIAEIERLRSLRTKDSWSEARALASDLGQELVETSGAHSSLAIVAKIWKLALIQLSLGDDAGMAELREFVHSSYARIFPEAHPSLLSAKKNLAIARKKNEDLDGALELEEQVRALMKRDLDEGDPALLGLEFNLANTLVRRGDYARALQVIEGVLAQRMLTLPEGHADLLNTMASVAVVRRRLGDINGALKLQEVVHDEFTHRLGDEHRDLLAAKQNLAITRKKLGDYAGAQELEEYVLDVRSRLLPEDNEALLLSKQNLAVTLKRLGDFERARRLEEDVLAQADQAFVPTGRRRLNAMHNLAVTLRESGDFDGALELLEAAHAVRAESLPRGHPDLLMSTLGLGWAYLRAGDAERARPYFEEGHAVRSEAIPRGHSDLLSTKQGLIRARALTGDKAGAWALMLDLVEGQLEVVAQLSTMAPRVARSTARVELRRFSWVLRSTEALAEGSPLAPGLRSKLFSVLEGLRSASVTSGMASRALADHPELSELRDELAQSRRAISRLMLGGVGADEGPDAWRTHVVAACRRRDSLQARMLDELSARGIEVELPTAAGVAGALPDSGAFLSFYRCGRERVIEKEGQQGAAESDTFSAFIVQPDASVTIVNVGPGADVERLVEEWRVVIGKPVTRGLSSAEEVSEEEAGQRLFQAVLAPCLEAFDSEPSTLHIVADDTLHLVPLDALSVDGDERLGDRVRVVLETSARRLVQTRPPAPEGNRLVAFGGIAFDEEGDVVDGSSTTGSTPPFSATRSAGSGLRQFPSLLQSEIEVESLEAIYGRTMEIDPLILTGSAASKGMLVKLAPEARWLHIATHGWFAPDTMSGAVERASAGIHADAAPLSAATAIESFAPHVLCGLALAGANRGVDELGKVPGIMTAEELAGLDLSRCELAMLSACETGVGLFRPGQGIQSLQSALHAAGARTAVTSLWKVDDAATRRLVEHFYSGIWEGGLSPSAALSKAKQALRDRGHPPRDWAAFVMTGDPD